MTHHRDPEPASGDITAFSHSDEDWGDLLNDLPAEARLLAEGMLQCEDADLRIWLTRRGGAELTPVRLVDAKPQASDLR